MKDSLRALAALLPLAMSVEAADAAKARKKLDASYIAFTGEEFVQRASGNDKKTVDLFIEAGIPLDSTDDRGRTALHAVADETDGKILDALLKAGASPDVADKDGTTPLCVAAEHGAAGNVALLLQARADVAAPCGRDGETALHEAADSDRAAVAQQLVAAGAPLNARDRHFETPLLEAAGESGGAALRVLLAAHAEVNVKGGHGETPLHEAVNARALASVQSLLAAGASVDARNFRGETALFEAARNGSLDVISVLLQAGANPQARDTTGETPSGIARKVGQLDVARALESATRAAVPARSPAPPVADPRQELARLGLAFDEATFFHRVEAGDDVALALFLQAGFAPGTPGPDGRSALALVAERGLTDGARALLANGADPDDGGRESGETPLMKAVNRRDPELVTVLLEARAGVNRKDKAGYTALTRAAAMGWADMVALLVHAGADVNATAADGTPVLMGPVATGQVEVVRMLLQAGARPGKHRASLLEAARGPEIKKLLQGAR
jgi:ankyrin repeat protein